LQAGLHRLGYLNGDADGVVGASTRQAVRAFQRARGLPADGYASRSLIKRVGDANVAGA
jgi:membrane-bound lytic murein transglycosylase B